MTISLETPLEVISFKCLAPEMEPAPSWFEESLISYDNRQRIILKQDNFIRSIKTLYTSLALDPPPIKMSFYLLYLAASCISRSFSAPPIIFSFFGQIG